MPYLLLSEEPSHVPGSADDANDVHAVFDGAIVDYILAGRKAAEVWGQLLAFLSDL